jgi:4-diphosphocytidyl-2-C-methyl-D-erythritol kinase
MSKAVVTTFAKLNLVLKVFCSETAGGLHPIASLFQTISLSDRLLIQRGLSPGLVLETDHPELQDASQNLIFKIYTDFSNHIPFGLHVRLEKNIPIGGGLGGGSGNAAGFLAYLNHVCEWGWSQSHLVDVGLRYGSDVPFFFLGGTALVHGVGEKLSRCLPEYTGSFVLANPCIHMSTPAIFRAFDAAHLGELPRDVSVDWVRSLPLGENDLSKVVFDQYPIYRDLAAFLDPFGLSFYLSGSGATVFVPVLDADSGVALCAELTKRLPSWQFFHVSTVPGPGYRLDII